MIRFFDLFIAFFGFIILLPVYFFISIVILIDSGFPIFYIQERIGFKGKKFNLFKFRTMILESDLEGLLTVGVKDIRVTRTGVYLRKFKLDELPQLFNVIIGDMALVGPRPEVEKFVLKYNDAQKKVLDVRPGITDLASIEYIDENEILGNAVDPERTYLEEIMPHKLEINLKYIEERTFLKNIDVLFRTIIKIVR